MKSFDDKCLNEFQFNVETRFFEDSFTTKDLIVCFDKLNILKIV